MTDISGNIVKDEKGRVLAVLYDVDGVVRVARTACCSIGEFFLILCWLIDLGYAVK